MLWHVLMPRVCASAKLRSNREWICTVKKGNTRFIVSAVRWKKRQRRSSRRVFSRFLPVMLELHNPGYSHYKSCCLDFRPQTGDRLCNLVSFSIPLSFTGRCLALLAGYLLATLKATLFFFAYLSIRYTQLQCVHCLCTRSHVEITAAERVNRIGCSKLNGYCIFIQICCPQKAFYGADPPPIRAPSLPGQGRMSGLELGDIMGCVACNY